jgi:hypothetical protein
MMYDYLDQEQDQEQDPQRPELPEREDPPYDYSKQDREDEDQATQWSRPEDFRRPGAPAANNAAVTWSDPSEFGRKQTPPPPAAPKQALTHPREQVQSTIKYPQVPGSVKEFADDTGYILGRASEGLGGGMLRDVLDVAVGSVPQRAVAKENLKGALSGMANESQRVWGELSAAGQNMVDYGKHVVGGQGTEARNDLVSMIYHGLGAIPMFGAPGQAIVDEVGQGRYRDAAGDALALAGSVYHPEAPSGPRTLLKNPKIGLNMVRDPEALAAQKYIMEKGAPGNAAAATASPYVRVVQKAAELVPGAALAVAEPRHGKAVKVIERVGEELKDRNATTAYVAETAGDAVRQQLEAKIGMAHDLANQEYGELRRIEALPENTKNIQIGTQTIDTGLLDANGQPITRTQPIMKQIALPADMRNLASVLRSTYEEIKEWMPIARRQASPGFTVLENIVNDGQDFIPVSKAESALSAAKEIAREAPQGRSQGLAKWIIPQLQAVITAATDVPIDVSATKTTLGPIAQRLQQRLGIPLQTLPGGQTLMNFINGGDQVPVSQVRAALKDMSKLARRDVNLGRTLRQAVKDVAARDPQMALENGRAATSAKYATKEVLEQLRQEPVQAFNQLTYAQDAGVDFLRKVQAEVPGAMRGVGRGYLDKLFGLGPDMAFKSWRNLGPSTKGILFDPLLLPEIDKLVRANRDVHLNPNPSGTAVVTGATAGLGGLYLNPPAALGGAAVGISATALLRSKIGVRLLTEGLRVPIYSPRALPLFQAMRRLAMMDTQAQRDKEIQQNEALRRQQSGQQYAKGGKVGYDDGGEVDEEEDPFLRDLVRRRTVQTQPFNIDLERSRLGAFGADPPREKMGPREARPTYSNIPGDTSYGQATPQINVMPEWYQQADKAINGPDTMPLAGPPGLAGTFRDSIGTGVSDVVGGLSMAIQANGPRDVARGTGEVVSGLMDAATPLLGAGIQTPKHILDLSLKLGAGMLTQQAVEEAARHFGMPEEYAGLLGVATGIAAAHHTPVSEELLAAAQNAPGAVQDLVNQLNYSGGSPERGSISNRPTNAAGERVRGTWDDKEKEYKPHPTDVERLSERRYRELTGLRSYDVAGSKREQGLVDKGHPRSVREANSILSWQNWDRPEMEAKYGPLVESHPLDLKRERFQNTPEQVRRRIQNARDFLRQPVEEFEQPDFGVFDRSLIKDSMEGFPDVQQTQHARTAAPQADLSHVTQTYDDNPITEELIRLGVDRGRRLKGDLFYPSVYPFKAAALDRGLSEDQFNKWVWGVSPASAVNSVMAENSGGNLLYSMWKRRIPLTKENLEREKYLFKQRYGVSPSLMETHLGPTAKILEQGILPPDVIMHNLTDRYKIPTYALSKSGDFKNYFVGDVHESRGTTLASRWHPYFATQEGFSGNEYGPTENYMRNLARKIGIATGPMQGARWHGMGELTNLKSEPGDWLNTIEKQAAYTMHGRGMRTQPKDVRNYLLDLVEHGGDLAPYSGGDPIPDRRVHAPTTSRRRRSSRGR